MRIKESFKLESMKIFLLKYILYIPVIMMFLSSYTVKSQDFDVSKYRMMFKLQTTKQHDNTRIFEVSFIARNKKDRKDRIPIYNAEIQFYNILDTEEVLLGSARTSEEGISQLILPEDFSYMKDDEGSITVSAKFNGTDAIKKMGKEIVFKDLHLELDLAEVDSIKMVIVNAFTIDSLGIKSPLEASDITISIQGMLSKMKIEEGTIEDGVFEFEFPNDLPGDANGEIIVFSIIEDNDEFGSLIKKKSVDWGTFDDQIVKKRNTLWSEAAPLWMYIVLAILLIGVWANYFYTVINIFKIKKEGQELE